MSARLRTEPLQQKVSESALEPYSRSLHQFCNFVEHCSQQVDDFQAIAEICEEHAEAVRLTSRDVNMETIDMLLNTMLNTLYYMSETQEQKRWGNRLKGVIFGKGSPQHFQQEAMAFQNS